MKTLKLFNGRHYSVILERNQPSGTHVFVAAYDVEDARRVCVEAGLRDPGRNEINIYWSKCWGNDMDGIPVERGIWIRHGYFKIPERVLPKTA
jgi:hypothetical protein